MSCEGAPSLSSSTRIHLVLAVSRGISYIVHNDVIAKRIPTLLLSRRRFPRPLESVRRPPTNILPLGEAIQSIIYAFTWKPVDSWLPLAYMAPAPWLGVVEGAPFNALSLFPTP